MRYAEKKEKIVRAWELGAGSEMERRLIREGAIQREADGSYRLFSLEAIHHVGEKARAGDYFKVDTREGRHFPYPNERKWFMERHRAIGTDEYVQTAKLVPIWMKGDPPNPLIDFLLSSGRLTLDASRKERYFNATMWDAPLSAAEDAVIVFRDIQYDASGKPTDISFDFVARDMFERDYTRMEP